MKWSYVLLIVVVAMVLSGCKPKTADFTFEFPLDVTCNDSSVDYIELSALEFPEGIDSGFLHSYVSDFGQFIYVFHNPEAEFSKDEYITNGAYGHRFFDSDSVFLATEIPEGYHLESVTYKYTSMCEDTDDEAFISENIAKSFLYFSETEYTETELNNQHPELFE